jgi:transcriptional regulator with XRE-family HTH domain
VASVAEPSAISIGRYLRELRERRGFSLARVCELSHSTSDPIDKGTLSRYERGQQTPSIHRLGPLCRIYEITADALLERMELDREVDRVGGPETIGRTYEQLYAAGAAAVARGGNKWDAYACFRDALPLAPPEKLFAAWINLVNRIRVLGKNALALHELREIERSISLAPDQRALVHGRMANCLRCLGETRQAEALANSAIAQAGTFDDPFVLAYAYSSRAELAIDQGEWQSAYDLLMKALAAHREGDERDSRLAEIPFFEAQMFVKMAECSLNLGATSRARRLALAARRTCREHDWANGLAYAEVYLGLVDERDGRADLALVRWRRAAAIAKKIEDPRILFSAEVEIFRQALAAGDKALARASRRRLERIAPWIQKHIPAYKRYKELVESEGGKHEEAQRGQVAHVRNRTGVGARRLRSVGRQPPDQSGRLPPDQSAGS